MLRKIYSIVCFLVFGLVTYVFIKQIYLALFSLINFKQNYDFGYQIGYFLGWFVVLFLLAFVAYWLLRTGQKFWRKK